MFTFSFLTSFLIIDYALLDIIYLKVSYRINQYYLCDLLKLFKYWGFQIYKFAKLTVHWNRY